MVIPRINYQRPGMVQTEWDQCYTPERATPFLSVPGPQWKIWLDGPEERRAGGIYLFADRDSAEGYVSGPVVARMPADPDIGDLDIRGFDVRHDMSEITRAPLPSLPLAAE